MPPTVGTTLPQVGARVGRFQILDRLGAGGAGEVFAAYDPQLDRRIAIKFLLGGALSDPHEADRATRRLIREGRALAHIEHPNVVGVLDVGTDQGRVFMAMDYVQGVTLKEWLRRNPPGRKQLPRALELLQQAGRGLAAAHARGLIHRDVKPSNILVGDDGRVRVADFGLARSGKGPRAPSRPSSDVAPPVEHGVEQAGAEQAVDDQVTRTGAVAGTPAYMAPEQLAGEPLNIQTDQFGFCMVAWEMIFGVRPSRVDMLTGDAPAAMLPPTGFEYVPARIVAALGKGLAARPEQRHRTMTKLLTALEPPRSRRAARQRSVLAILGALGVGGGVVALATSSSVPPCEIGQEQVQRVWGPPQRQAVQDALFAAAATHAPDTTPRVHQALDDYAEAWANGHRQACEATHVRHEQSDDLLALRMACLERRRQQLQATVQVLVEADDSVAVRALSVVNGLPRVEPCADPQFIRAELEPPEDPQQRALVEDLRDELAHAKVLRRAGKYDQSTERADAVLTRAHQLGYPPLTAAAQLAAGSARAKSDDPQAEQLLQRAFTSALAIGDDATAAVAAERLAYLVGMRRRRYAEGLSWVEIALATAARHDDAEGMVAARAIRTRGTINNQQGDLTGAMEAIDAARVLYETNGSSSGLHVLLEDEGNVLMDQGRFEAAQERFEQALALRLERYGNHHPRVGISYHGLALAQMRRGELADAEANLTRARAIVAEFYGPDNPREAELLNALGGLLNMDGRDEEALPNHQRAHAIFETAYGPKHPLVAASLANIAITQHGLGDYAAAETNLQRAIELQLAHGGPDNPDLAGSYGALGNLLHERGRLEDALGHYGRAQALYASSGGQTHPRVLHMVADRSALLEQLGRSSQALAELQAMYAAVVKERGETDSDARSLAERIQRLKDSTGQTETAPRASAPGPSQ